MHSRKQKRVSTEGLGLNGELILHPDPKPIKTELIDISEGGAGIRIAGSVSEEQKRMLDLLVRNAQSGKRTPVAFSFNDAKIPIVIMNNWDNNCYGFTISESGHQQLASLAARGRNFFQAMVQTAISKGAGEAGITEYPILSMEFLPPDIKTFVQNREFFALFMPALATSLVELIPSIKRSIASVHDMHHLQAVLFRFLKEQGRDIQLIMGAALHFMRLREGEPLLQKLVIPATKHLVDEDRLISFEEQARLRDLFLEDMAIRQRNAQAKGSAGAVPGAEKKSGIEAIPAEGGGAASSLKEVPEKHPLANIVKTRFDAFNRKIFFIQKLAPAITDHYFNKYLPRDHEMIEIAQEEPRLAKTMLPRWVQNEMQEISGSKDHRLHGMIEERFRVAIFEYMIGRRIQNITLEEIQDLFEGKISSQFSGVREKFLNAVCDLIHPGIMHRFGDFVAAIESERSKKRAEKENEVRISKLYPPDLAKEFLWPKVVEMGEILPLQREFAKAWVDSEQQFISISALGSVVVVPSETFVEFSKLVDRYASEGVKASDFFVKVDLGELYRRTIKMRDGSEAKDVFGRHVDTLLPLVARENCMSKVFSYQANCIYYVLNKSKSYLTKVFGKGADEAIQLINGNMLTVEEKSENFI